MGTPDISSLKITPDILRLIAELDEFKGAWRALGQLAPEQLSNLKRVATIESIGSSTRIEGSQLTDQQVERLLANLKTKSFATRDEQEVAGYADVMNALFVHYATTPFTENYIKQFHRDLLNYSEKDDWHRGNYKTSSNHVEAFDADGKSLGIIFETSMPFETPHHMRDLMVWLEQSIREKELHPLLIIGIFNVVFLAIHPFQDGNGRLSRILTTWLMIQAGYVYVPYSSWEAVIEQSKNQYYLSLRQTQSTLRKPAPDWHPWLRFFLRTLHEQKNQLEYKLQQEQSLLTSLPPLSVQMLAHVKSRGKATIGELVTLTKANRNTVKKHLERLLKANLIQKHGSGKGTWYSM